MSIARNVQFTIRSGKDQEFTRLFNAEVLPLLKKQEGFREELALVNGGHAMGISVWENRQSAEKYQAGVYPEILKKLNPVIEGPPKVEMYDVAAATAAH